MINKIISVGGYAYMIKQVVDGQVKAVNYFFDGEKFCFGTKELEISIVDLPVGEVGLAQMKIRYTKPADEQAKSEPEKPKRGRTSAK